MEFGKDDIDFEEHYSVFEELFFSRKEHEILIIQITGIMNVFDKDKTLQKTLKEKMDFLNDLDIQFRSLRRTVRECIEINAYGVNKDYRIKTKAKETEEYISQAWDIFDVDTKQALLPRSNISDLIGVFYPEFYKKKYGLKTRFSNILNFSFYPPSDELSHWLSVFNRCIVSVGFLKHMKLGGDLFIRTYREGTEDAYLELSIFSEDFRKSIIAWHALSENLQKHLIVADFDKYLKGIVHIEDGKVIDLTEKIKNAELGKIPACEQVVPLLDLIDEFINNPEVEAVLKSLDEDVELLDFLIDEDH